MYARDAERQLESATSDFPALSDSQTSSAIPHELLPAPTTPHSGSIPSAKKPRMKGNPHRCDICSKSFTRGTTLREHARTHTNERPYKCSTCIKGVSRLKDCRRHELLHLNGKRFICGDHEDRENLKGHWRCGREFSRKYALREHLKSIKAAGCLEWIFELHRRDLLHFEGKLWCKSLPHKIGGCGRKFRTLDAFKEHLGIHEEGFEGVSEYRKLAILDSAKIRAMSCLNCEISFVTLNELLEHIDLPFQEHCLKSEAILCQLGQ